MRLFDSHCHLDDKVYVDDFDTVLERMALGGVEGAMIAGVTLKSSENAVRLSEKYNGIYAAVGIHPHDASDCSEDILDTLSALAKKSEKVRAWGETGLDFNRMFSAREDQERWFRRQIETAGKLSLPLIFHERDSGGRFLEILEEYRNHGLCGVVHCFSGNRSEMEAYLDMGLYIGVTGIITIKGRGKLLRELAPLVPVERLLVETDAPYLVPAPEKNKTRRNEPAFVKSVFMKVAEARGDDPETLAEQVWQNTADLFNIM